MNLSKLINSFVIKRLRLVKSRLIFIKKGYLILIYNQCSNLLLHRLHSIRLKNIQSLFSIEDVEKLHFSRIFLCLVSMQQCRLIAAISHLSDVGCGKSGALIIRLNDAILFDTGSDIIKVNARNTFDKLVVVLKEVPNSIKLEGLTCNKLIKILKLPSNWNLSIAGAIKIVVKKHDFDLKRLLIAGYGCCLPVSCNLTKKLI